MEYGYMYLSKLVTGLSKYGTLTIAAVVSDIKTVEICLISDTPPPVF